MRSLRSQVTGLLLLVSAGGCQHLANWCPFLPGEEAPAGPVCKVVSTWNNQVVYTPDPVNGGVPTPGLAGRVYLFDQTVGFPLVGDGTLIVDAYDARPEVNGGKPLFIEQWRFDPDSLRKLLRKDTIGDGYTVFLPWGTYKPEINRVMLKVCYQPAKGLPIYADTVTVTLSAGQRSRGLAAAAR